MSLHPIKALNQVIDEYKDFLLTEFRAKDPKLKESLEREIEKPGFLAQEPFFQAHRPFKEGKKWQDLSIDQKLAKVMESKSKSQYCYLHQSQSIDNLLSDTATPIVITTGTGSGKTECFLLPVIQNAIEDSIAFKRSGLTAILLYPMNALANDQLERIDDYLKGVGFSANVKVAKYDRGTTQAERELLRKNPPHILLTNYMMLEYLLVRPADREAIFANHRCRFFVLDEVHTYRGALGSNIALLVRRVKAHLKHALQDWGTDQPENLRRKRFPELITIGTSATIKSEIEEGLSKEELIKRRDNDIQEFFSKLTGVQKETIQVIGEELQDVSVPSQARYSESPADIKDLDFTNREFLIKALCMLSGISETTDMNTAANHCRLIWDLNAWLIKKPMSLSQIADKVFETIPERKSFTREQIQKEIEIALLAGGAIPDDIPGALRIKAHQFIRGGWSFYRCVDPNCGKLYPKGEERCECGKMTAPLYLCRNCGADYLRLTGDEEANQLKPSRSLSDDFEWLIYQPDKFEELHDEYDENGTEEEEPKEKFSKKIVTSMKGRPILSGSLDVASLIFSKDKSDYPLKVILSPARNRCLCCGGTAGSRNVISPVALGTSAAIKVLSEGTIEALEEAHKDEHARDKKERLLIFSDSRQDAAHQARFIRFASRYDRMRRRVVQILAQESPLSLQRIVELLSVLGEQNNDNPYLSEGGGWISPEARKRMQIYEEAPLLDELAVNAGFRATVINLGMVGVHYDQLDEYIKEAGNRISSQLGVNEDQFYYLCKTILDRMRVLGCLNRELLTYHSANLKAPDYLNAAEWERKVKYPKGFAADNAGNPLGYRDPSEIPDGIKMHNSWRKPGAGGKGPALQRIFEHVMTRMGAKEAKEEILIDILNFLKRGSFIVASELHGYRQSAKLLQINTERLRLKLLEEISRSKCSVCSSITSDVTAGMPCANCHGKLVTMSDEEVNRSRYVRRIRTAALPVLEAEEHTAQVSNEERLNIEEKFKAPSTVSKLNILACSPTLEMGIDVGGLDAVLVRNIPPRPDNYAQRGGRAGRRQRVGLVLGYVRNTPHDQYFYEHPEEMIAGEVIAPQISLGNRDVILRHLNAIIFGASEPGLAGKMVEYVNPSGDIDQGKVDTFINGVKQKTGYALDLAKEAWGSLIFETAKLGDSLLKDALEKMPDQIQDVFSRTSRQVKELRQSLEMFHKELKGARGAVRAGILISRILGIETGLRERKEADDRSSGYPLRRFAEFGILPGYEFPDQPSSLRLLGDMHEEDLISVGRRFGIAQYQPDAQVYARAKRWKVIGLDTSSPWNPYGAEQKWSYRVCLKCGLRFGADEPRCLRCKDDSPGKSIQAAEYAGFLGSRSEAPVLDEEERYAVRSSVRGYPQWDGDVIGRWSVGNGWGLRLSKEENVIWLNEGSRPSLRDIETGWPLLHNEAKGFILCTSCGHILAPQLPEVNGGGRKKPKKKEGADPYGHSQKCALRGLPEDPVAISTENRVEILRLVVPIPGTISETALNEWGLSLGYALRAGMRHKYSLDGSEIEFLLEGPWNVKLDDLTYNQVALTFIDSHIGGSGYLPRIATEFDKVAKESESFLQHKDCDSACYRCLKTYQNQRFHDFLNWPRIMPDLSSLLSTPVVKRPLEVGDIDDPKPWLDAFAAGVGSPLELKFLKLFEQHGLAVTKQEPVAPKDGDKPISLADFAIKDRRIAIYVDGAAFHVGQNLRRDLFIREKLRNGTPPWKVVELRALDLAKGKELVEEIKNM